MFTDSFVFSYFSSPTLLQIFLFRCFYPGYGIIYLSHHLFAHCLSGSQTAAPTFGQAQFGNQAGGTRIKPYAQTPDVDGATSGTQPAKLDSISAMPEYKDKSHEELRWEDYQRGDKGEGNNLGMLFLICKHFLNYIYV